MNSLNLPKWLLLFAFLGCVGCTGKYAKPETVETKQEKRISIDITEKLDSQIKRNPGIFSLRFAYFSGKNDAKMGFEKPENKRHSLHNLMANASFYFVKQNYDSTKVYLDKLEEKLEDYKQNKRIQVGKMTLYNVSTEFYLSLYEKTKDLDYLDKATSYNKKVFEVHEDKTYSNLEEREDYVDEEHTSEFLEACENLRKIQELESGK
ncbi:MAG: hypothetical protein ACTSXD_06590 [Candidatus Heimdallarchaeaceae archaeon]